MIIIGRLTRDAEVNNLKDGRQVLHFSIAIHQTFKPKAGKRVRVTTYCRCTYWISTKLAPHLRRGTLVELWGRLYATAYVSKDGIAKAALNCHVNNIQLLAWPREVQVAGRPAQEDPDDIPF